MFTILALTVIINLTIKAQPFVTITDPVWANYLTVNYPSCMSGNVLNGGCPALTVPNTLNVSGLGLTNIAGIQYFTNVWTLNVSNNSLTVLPMLANAVYSLVANNNSLTTITNFPPNCQYIYLQNNQLGYLPAVGTTSGLTLYCGNNNITCFAPFPVNSQTLNLLPNPFVCLPNHVPSAMNGALLATPICSAGNIYNCPGVNAISGSFYKDMNTDCIKNNGDVNLAGIGVKLYNNTNSVIAQYYSTTSYSYGLSAPVGTYIVRIDSAGLPLLPQCLSPAYDSVNIVLSGGNPSASNVNFNFDCKPGFDIGCTGRWLQGWVFPGQSHRMSVNAGNNVNFGNLSCLGGLAGQVMVSVTGPVTIVGPYAGALVPVISGNTCTYNIANFASITNPNSAFKLVLSTSFSATIGQSICVTVDVTPTAGDNSLSNNTYTFCHPVGNSYDPNEKNTYPVDVLPGYTGWFNYEVHFQNLGNAPAFNIRVLDTLDTNLDLRTFQVVSSTDPFNVAINGSIANFFFPNIMLPDSASDPEGSKATIQYRIKPKAGMVNGSKIKNRAHIYFDYNPAVVTNQTINNFTLLTSLSDLTKTDMVNIYPNPVKNKFNIVFEEDARRTISLNDILGKEIFSRQVENKNVTIETDQFENGIYFLKITRNSQSAVFKVIIEK